MPEQKHAAFFVKKNQSGCPALFGVAHERTLHAGDRRLMK